MITLGSGDGRKRLGLGFDVGGEMEETELEEGEACYYQNDDDSTIDPDVALSYIDEKLQDVLGHFQKDFEGGVSAENLGAKFGGYGSFLPTYQRSPSASSHPRTPPEVHNYSGPRSPNNIHVEGGHHISLVPSNTSVSARLAPASVNGVSLPAVKAPPVNDYSALSTHAEDSPSNFEDFTKSANPLDQKNLKVRIKVSSDNLLTRKNAEIYSGLGLDVSPSSSLDGSPMDIDGLSHELFDAPYESPTSILQVITSLPVDGGLLLSPLPVDLIRLIEKAKLRRKVLVEKKRKTSEKYVISRDLKNEYSNNDARNSIDVPPKKETDINTLACEEIVSNALRLPLLSNSYCNVVESAKGNFRDIDTSNTTSKKKSKGSTNPGANVSKSEGEDFRKDEYKDFFGEIKSEKEDDAKASDEIVCGDRLTNLMAVIENGPLEFNGASRERSNIKKSERLSPLEAYRRTASKIVPLNGNGPTSSADGAVPPVVKEDWVCCDKCQKWRLLPLGTSPNSLPEKWLCSMLYWLPGFNRCSIPQEETTKGVITRYQVPAPAAAPAPVSQSSQHDHANGIQLGVSLADARSSGQNQQDLGLHILPGRKNKEEFEDVSNTNTKDGPQFSNSTKKNVKESVKSRSVNGESRSPTVNDKKKVLESHCGGGDSLNSKIRIKSEAAQDSVVASKKIKIDDFNNIDDDWMSDHGGAILKVDRSTSISFSMNDLTKESKHQSKSSVGNPEDSTQITSEDGLLYMGKRDDRDAVKKRIGTECHDTQIYTDSQENRDLVEETSENDRKREKKTKISKSSGEETDKKGTSMVDQKLGPDPGGARSHWSLDAVGSLKRETGSVSSSHKDKFKHQEVKGSPVESVSSSPLRISNPDNKFTSTRRNLGPKNDCEAGSSPRICIDGKDETLTVTQRGPLETSVHDFDDRALGHVSSDKAKEFGSSDHLTNEERGNNNQYHAHGSHPRKSGKGPSSRSKEKSKSGRSDKGNLKRSDCFNKSEAGRNKVQEKSSVNLDRVEKSLVSKKDSTGKMFSESGKKEIQTNCGPHDDSDVKVVAISNQELKPETDRDGEKSLKMFPSDKTDRVSGKSHSLPPSGRVLNEPSRWPQSISVKENGTNALSVEASEGGDDPLKAPKQIKKAENQNGNPLIKSKNPLPNGVKVKRDVDAPSPVRRDSSNQSASNAVKEAKDLKHLADRLKNSGSNAESTGIYFQAALKFLHGASLLESCNSESSKHGEIIQSIQMYSSTAKLCEFCAHEYEKSKDMAAAALAYKCMEVAYLRVIYSSHTSASRDRNELQTAMQIVAPGESPSSSASDIENLNHSATVDKAAAALSKGITSPQVAGNHVIAARNRPNFVRLLNFAQDVNFAMEASRKSRIAFAAASPKLEDAKYKDGISSVKKALDFNFQDVEGVLHMVRVAMEIINR